MPDETKAELQKQLDLIGGKSSDQLDLVPILEKLAINCHRSQEWAEAQSYYERILEIRNAAWTSRTNTVALIKTSHCLGLLNRIKNEFADAEPHYLRALELSQSHYGESTAETAMRRNYLAGLYFAWGKYDQAADLLNNSLKFYEQTLGKDNQVTAVCLYALALVARRSDWEASSAYFERSVNLMKVDITKLSMDNHHDLFSALMHLSHERFSEGKYEEAEELFRHSLLTELEEIWPKHPLVTDSYQLLGNLYRSFGMATQAEFVYRNALSVRQQVYGENDQNVAASAHALGTFLSEQERYEEAEPLLKAACQIYRNGAFPPLLANSLKAYAVVLKNRNRQSESLELTKEADEILDKHGLQSKARRGAP